MSANGTPSSMQYQHRASPDHGAACARSISDSIAPSRFSTIRLGYPTIRLGNCLLMLLGSHCSGVVTSLTAFPRMLVRRLLR
eukprot:2376399-Pleurochrysis_carterae.AAC.6